MAGKSVSGTNEGIPPMIGPAVHPTPQPVTNSSAGTGGSGAYEDF